MIVICKCGQKNRLKAGLATGKVTASAINCGRCKASLVDTMVDQVERDSEIVRSILALATDEEMDPDKFVAEVVTVFNSMGLDLILDMNEDDGEDLDLPDEDEDENEDEDEPEPPKKKTWAKKKTSNKRAH